MPSTGSMPGGGFGAAGAAQHQAAGGGDQVAQHGRGRRGAAGALAVEHELAGGLGLDEHRVEGAVHGGQRMLAREQRGVDAHAHAPPTVAVSAVRRCSFSAMASSLMTKPASLAAAMSAAVTCVMPWQWTSSSAKARMEGQRGQDGGLGGGVVALDVRRRISLRVPQARWPRPARPQTARRWCPSGRG